MNGNIWTGTGTRKDINGKIYKIKASNTFSSDGKTCKTICELSADDGKTWMPLWELTLKKVKK